MRGPPLDSLTNRTIRVSGPLRRAASRLAPVRRFWTPLLVLWFAGQSYGRISTFIRNQVPLGLDARIYYRAVANWFAGEDPWRADVVFNHHTFSYAGTPATVVLLAPAAALPEMIFTALWLGITAAAAVWVIRRLELPPWWLLFPPITELFYSGNPQMVVLALLLAGGRTATSHRTDRAASAASNAASNVAAGVAIGLKIYAIVPALGERRYRAAVFGVVITGATLLLAPGLWQSYIREFGAISARLAHQSEQGFSAFAYPLLLVPVGLLLGGLALVDRRAAGWLAVPAIWPASEFHYSTFALPVMSPLLAVLLAIPSQQLPPVAIGLDAILRLGAWALRRRAAGSDRRRPVEPRVPAPIRANACQRPSEWTTTPRGRRQ